MLRENKYLKGFKSFSVSKFKNNNLPQKIIFIVFIDLFEQTISN